MSNYKYLSMEYGVFRNADCNIHKSHGTLPAMQMHYHDFYQIYLITKGQLNHSTPSDQIILNSGDCFIIPPSFPHCIGRGTETPEFYSFSFRRNFLPESAVEHPPVKALMELLSPESLKLGLSLSSRDVHLLEQLLSHALEEYEGQRNGWECAVQGILSAILVILARAYTPDGHGDIPSPAAIQDSISYINQHFRENLRLEDILSRFHFSASGFYRAFRAHTGKSFQEYLTDCRTGLACTLLQDTDKPISVIANLCGSWDYTTFYRSFRKKTGMPPAKYRQARRQKH